MQPASAQPNRNKINLLLDSVMFAGFLVAMAPRFSGLAVHEWLGVAFGAAIVTHLLLHWRWIATVTRRFFGKLAAQSRINYILNSLLFIDITIITFTGLMISEVALPALGLPRASGGAWRGLHELSANLMLLLLGLHIALHWQWIVGMVKRFVVAPLAPGRRLPRPQAGSSQLQKRA